MMKPEEARQRILEIFRYLPFIKLEIDEVQNLAFPKLTLDDQRNLDDESDKEEHSETKKSEPKGKLNSPVLRLKDGLEQASNKLRFGATANEEWRDTILFSRDTVTRKSPNSRSSKGEPFWSEGDPINRSSSAFEDWFANTLLDRIQDGTRRHKVAITGAPGCGKSSLVKYAMSAFSADLEHRNIVFSRFEFLKFWDHWHVEGGDITVSLRHYMSFIHCRDLVLSYFFQFVGGNGFRLKRNFEQQVDLEQCLIHLAREMVINSGRDTEGIIGGDTDRDRDRKVKSSPEYLLLHHVVSSAQQGNAHLKDYLQGLRHSKRKSLIEVLWERRTLVTVFDGMDALNVEDAVQNTQKWTAIKEIILRRKDLSVPESFRQMGVAVKADSIVIMRRNTMAFLRNDPELEDPIGITRVYKVENIDGLSAIVSVVSRSTRFIGDAKDLSEDEKKKFVQAVVSISQRIFIAIARGHGPRVAASIIYGVFDGNLRELFDFISRSLSRYIDEVIALKDLDGEILFGDTATFVEEVERECTGYLRRKSYRIVEMLLFEGPSFENQLKLGGIRRTQMRVRKNRRAKGFVDNIFNYHEQGPMMNLDTHSLLEKIRVVQCLENANMTQAELEDALKNNFGYLPQDIYSLLMFLTKSNLIAAEITADPEDEDIYDFLYSSTVRSKLIMSSLIQNMAYLEHIFHKTKFPKKLIQHISDKPKDKVGAESWAARSLNNVFILLCYLRHVEQNAPSQQVANPELRVFDSMHESVSRSIAGIVDEAGLNKALDAQIDVDGELESEYSEGAADRIAPDAFVRLSSTYSVWKRGGCVPTSQRVQPLEPTR
ncbi:hypothetical protein Q5Y75_23525 [Ruegeria sp. 2205SS24-7]|uniref:hypothetical protein n=1 Tax=Ruegeria discodermiae TaxID=3064389 RepID=UPI002741639D|nr:hypothetical protein [Ruegeria sp. 2205SS24-7]MDP5220169.1 hypothetical protein [Ruegeria sp. 2205SS24-7]